MMRLKTLFATFFILTAGSNSVLGAGQGNDMRVPQFGVEVSGDSFIPVPGVDVPGGSPIVVAQATSTQQLEELVRQLSGKVEELNFQVLQLQEQMRKMQEDNEFRFQELENSKQGGLAPKDSGNDVAAAPSDGTTPSADGETSADAGQAPSADNAGPAATGEQPRELGTIQFDEKGNPIGGTIDVPADPTADTASLPDASNPGEMYRIAYDHVLAGEYEQAESGFRQHVEQFPADAQTADARYWLGESLAAQGKHREAAEILLDAQRDFPKSKKAPDMLLKLGMSLAALDNKDVACATYNQVLKKYPKAGAALLQRVGEEQSKAGC